jgi:hypothetical protein
MPSNVRTRRLLVVLALVAAAVLALPASAAATHDDYRTPEPMAEDDFIDDSNVGATVQSNPEYPSGEPLTAARPSTYCNNGSFSTTTGVFMGATRWYDVTGTGRNMVLETDGAEVDTVMAVYGPLSSDFRCDDDNGAGLNSRIEFNSRAGVSYAIQVGGIVTAGTPETGDFTLFVESAPANDARSAARTVDSGTSTASDNFAATTEPSSGELTSCTPPGGAAAPFDKTVWFRWTAPDFGNVRFVASDAATDTVLNVYTAGGGRVACSDDAVGSGTSSRVPLDGVRGGQTYEIQVGGYGAGAAADEGQFNLGVEFDIDLDEDNDNSPRPADCRDQDGAIHPNAKDVRNGVDDNCDNIVDPDMDEDDYLRPPLGKDCDDNDRRVHPGATDVRGNRLNEDCVGKPAPFRRIGADVRLRGVAKQAFEVTELLVQDVPRGAKVSVSCRPGCGSGHAAVAAGTKRIVGIKKRLPAGTVMSVRVTRRKYIGFFQKVTIRAFAVPKYGRPMCLMPGSRKPKRRCSGIR